MISKRIDFLVCIHCMTYNHAPFIEDTMNGFCLQRTTFPFVAVIVDDASTDNEPEVIRHYVNHHFDIENAECWETDDAHFIYTRHKENLNCFFLVILLKYNFWQIKKNKAPLYAKYEKQSKYIAICEGDDYWMVENKLQVQVDYLTKNPDSGLVFNSSKVYDQAKGIFVGVWGGDTNFERLIHINQITTCSVLLRKSLYEEYRNEIGCHVDWKMGDYPIWLYIAAKYKVNCLDNLSGTTVYRILKNSASHFDSLSEHVQFENSAASVKYFFVNKYNTKYLIPLIRIDTLNVLIDHSLRLNQRLPLIVVIPFLRSFKDLFKILIRFFICQFKLGRCLLLRRNEKSCINSSKFG